MESTNTPDSAQPSPDTGGVSGSALASATASVSISNTSTGTSTPSIPNIQPNQAAQLAQRFTNEIELAKAAGSDVEKAKQHYQKAESIKRILISYRAQKKAKQEAENSESIANSNADSKGNSTSISSTNLTTNLTNSINPAYPTTSNATNASPTSDSITAIQSPASAIQSPVPIPAVASLVDTSSQSPQVSRPQTPSEINTKAVSIDLFNQVRSSLQDLLKKIQKLEDSKTAESDPDKVESTNTELSKLKPKVSQYQKIAVYMKNQLIQQGKLSANGGPLSQSMSSQPSPSPAIISRPSTGENTPVVQSQTLKIDSKPETSTSKLSNNSKFALTSSDQSADQSAAPSSSFVAARAGPIGSLTNPLDSSAQRPQPFTTTSSYSTLGRAAIPTSTSAVNLRTGSFGSRPGITNGFRPGLGMHSATDFNSYSTLGSFHNSTSSNISDNGGRVLTKRKLVDLVNNIGMGEGDAKTTMDNDVEEILLDLADEFISSVTGFACQIAKHRKVDKVDIRDFQLHLERNWGIKVPDFSLDETKSVRKWSPTADYTAKVSEIESAQTNGDETSKVEFSSKK